MDDETRRKIEDKLTEAEADLRKFVEWANRELAKREGAAAALKALLDDTQETE
jgi:hypothetical protein